MIEKNRTKLRIATEGDLMLLFNWRNKDFVRNSSLNNNIIDLETHLKWFLPAIRNPNQFFYIFLLDNQPTGLVRFNNTNKDEVFWSFYLGESNTLKGSGSAMAFLAIDEFFDIKKNSNSIFGEVIEENSRSEYFHQKMGFQLLRAENRFNETRNLNLKIKIYSLSRDHWNNQEKYLYSKIFI